MKCDMITDVFLLVIFFRNKKKLFQDSHTFKAYSEAYPELMFELFKIY